MAKSYMSIFSSFHWYHLRATQDWYLNATEVKSLIKKYDFYCSEKYKEFSHGTVDYENPRGRGIHSMLPVAFELHHNGKVVRDRLTGLCWQRGGSRRQLTRAAADSYIDDLRMTDYGGFSDWRLPTLEEAMSLVEPKAENFDPNAPNFVPLHTNPIFDARQRWILTADKFIAGHRAQEEIWGVHFAGGHCELIAEKDPLYVRAVRYGDIEEGQFREVRPEDLEKASSPTKSESRYPGFSRCDFCKGTGRQACQMCGSAGSITRSYPGAFQTTTMTTPCPGCGGSGFVSCHKCHGLARA